MLLIVSLSLGVLAGCTTAARYERMSPQDKLIYDLALAHGVNQFNKVERIDFTFNVHSGDRSNKRSWSWRPRTHLVTYDNQFTYQRGQLAGRTDESITSADRKFINDSFWLLMPLHLTWSKDVTVQDTGETMPPLGVKPQKRLVVTYSAAGGGYTPGDVYEMYVDKDYRLTEWAYHRGGAQTPTLVCTWQSYKKVGPLWLALDHVNKEIDFRLWFTDVTVWTTDGQSYAAAGP